MFISQVVTEKEFLLGGQLQQVVQSQFVSYCQKRSMLLRLEFEKKNGLFEGKVGDKQLSSLLYKTNCSHHIPSLAFCQKQRGQCDLGGS